MRNYFFFLLAVLMPLAAMAQAQFGYLSYQTVMKEMPEYIQSQQQLKDLHITCYDVEKD